MFPSLGTDQRTLMDFINFFVDIINLLLPVIVGLALLVFFKGLVTFIAKSGDTA